MLPYYSIYMVVWLATHCRWAILYQKIRTRGGQAASRQERALAML